MKKEEEELIKENKRGGGRLKNYFQMSPPPNPQLTMTSRFTNTTDCNKFCDILKIF